MFEFTPRGVCSTRIRFELLDGRIHNLAFDRGCNGNLQAISRLVEGLPADEVISRLKGVDCSGRGTSCADQLARALAAAESQE